MNSCISMQLKRSCRISGLIFPLIILVATSADAQLPDGSTNIESLIVTGSRVVTGEQSVSPVEVIGSEQIWDSAQPSLGDFIFQEVLQNNSADPDAEVGSTDGRLAGNRNVAVNLRGLGEENTLVLIDGMRTLNYPAPDGNGWSSVDINASIPRIALSRTELLLDGGSAIYGTDAVAGVVNLIPDYGFRGAKIQYSTTRVTEAADKDDFSFGLLVGTGNDTTSAIAAFDWRRRDLLLETDSNGDSTLDPFLQGNEITRFNYANFWDAGNVPIPRGGPNAVPQVDPLCGDTSAFPGQPPAFAGEVITIGTTDFCQGNQEIIPVYSRNPVDSFTAFAAIEHNFSDRLRATTNFSFSQTRLERQWEFGGTVTPFLDGDGDPYTIITPVTNPGVVYANSIDPGNWADPDGYVSRSYQAVPYQQTLPGFQEDQQVRLAGSLDYELNDDWSLGLDMIVGEGFAEVHRRYMVPDRMQAALDGLGGPECAPGTTPGTGTCSYWNPFLSAGLSNAETLGLANSTELADWIMPLDTRDFTTKLESYQLVLSGLLSQFELGGGSPGIAVGVERRVDSFDADFDPIMNQGGYNNQEGSPVPDYSGRITVDALFGELVLPVTDSLLVQLAARSEDYDNGFSTTNPKIGFNWAVNPDLTVRGSWGTSYKAPTIVQTQASRIVESSWINLCDTVQPNAAPGQAATEFCPRGFGGGGARISQGFFEVLAPNPDLKPQESDNWSVGFDWSITDQLSLGATLVSIEFQNVVDIPIANNILALDQCNSGVGILEDVFNPGDFQSSLTPGRQILIPAEGPGDTCFDLDPVTGLPTTVYIAPLNIAARNMDALDLSLGYQMNTDFGMLSISPNMTILLKHEEQQAPGAAFTDSVGVVPPGPAGGFSEYRMNLPFSIMRDEHRLSLTGRWASDIKAPNGAVITDHRYRGDLSYSYQFSDTYRVGLNVNNVGESNGSRTVVFRVEATFGE